MKKIQILFAAAAICLIASCSKEYDDSAINKRIDNLESRVSALEALCKQMNTNISSLQTLVTALQESDFITSVTPVTKDGVTVGYTITFTKSAPITIYHGENGKDGKDGKDGTDGYTPVIGVKQDADGVYYWTLDGEWLTDNSGKKIKAEGRDGQDGKDGADGKDGVDGQPGNDGIDGRDGKDGKDGITPQLKIEDGYWFISYDNGTTWTQLGKATGEDGKDGTNGKDGTDGKDGVDGQPGANDDSTFSSIDTSNSDYVIFTLSDGTQIKIPTWYAFEELRKLCNTLNTNIASLQTIVTALQNNDYITNITPLMDNGVQVGYTITFSKSGSIVIYHGKNGANGQDGHSPQIGVAKDADGIYYWTLDGKWLTDGSGNKIKAEGRDGQDGKDGADGKDGVDGQPGKDGTNGRDGEDGKDGADGKDGVDGQPGKDGTNGRDGEDGKDGITPQLKIEDGYWFISYDNGATWTQLGKATGEDGKDGTNGKDGADGKDGQSGKDGDSMFSEVSQDETNVYFTLTDGTIITIPLVSGSIISQINHIRYIPSYDDNNARMIRNEGVDDGIATLDYAISPKSILTVLDGHQDMISVISNPVQTRAVSFIEYPILDMLINSEQGTLSVTISGKNLDGNFFDGIIAANVILRISEGNSYIDAESVKMYSTSYSQQVIPDNQIWYKTSSGKEIEPHKNDFRESILSNTYTNGQGIMTFDGTVSKIPTNAFWNKEELVEIIIPNTVTIIESYAFYNCSLRSCNIPSSISEIGNNAFEGNTALSISIPNNVKKIGIEAFSGCAGTAYIDADFIVMVSNATQEYAKDYSFTGAAFSNVVLGPNVKDIRDNAFNKSSIRRIFIPNTVKSIGANAFLDCSQLVDVTIAGNITSFGHSAFSGCTGELNYYGDELVSATFSGAKFTAVNIFGNVKVIPKNCFTNCTLLAHILLPESVEELGNGAFQGCTSLRSISIPRNISIIPNNLFDGCALLTGIDFTQFNHIGDSAFRNCVSIKSVNFENIQTIGANAFEGCSGLDRIEISDKVESIGESSFSGCNAVKAISFGNSITSLPASAFNGCNGVEIVAIPDNIKSFESSTFAGCSSLKKLSIGSGVKTIPSSAFSNLTKLTNLQFSEGLNEIDSRAFYGCSALAEITVPNSIEYINSYAFSGCSSLKRFYCGSNILYIGDKAFTNCNLYMFRFEKNLPSAGETIFGVIGSTSSFRIYLPKNYNDVSTTNWVGYRQWFVYYD